MLVNYPFQWWLRCRFDFADGRPPWFSQWNKSGPNNSDMACYQNKNGLVRASIEGKHIQTREFRVFAECDGHDFCNFEWLAAVAAPLGTVGKLQGTNIGLVLVMRNVRCTVEMNGETRLDQRSEAEKKVHLAGYGR